MNERSSSLNNSFEIVDKTDKTTEKTEQNAGTSFAGTANQQHLIDREKFLTERVEKLPAEIETLLTNNSDPALIEIAFRDLEDYTIELESLKYK
jgi:hypothetical protein